MIHNISSTYEVPTVIGGGFKTTGIIYDFTTKVLTITRQPWNGLISETIPEIINNIHLPIDYIQIIKFVSNFRFQCMGGDYPNEIITLIKYANKIAETREYKIKELNHDLQQYKLKNDLQYTNIQELEDNLNKCKTTATLQIQLGKDKIQELENKISHYKSINKLQETKIIEFEKNASVLNLTNETQEVKIKDLQTKLSCYKSSNYSKLQEYENKILQLDSIIFQYQSINKSQETQIQELSILERDSLKRVSHLDDIIKKVTNEKNELLERLQYNEIKLNDIKIEYDKKIKYNEETYEATLMEQINTMSYKLEQIQDKLGSKKSTKCSKSKYEAEFANKYEKELKDFKNIYDNKIISMEQDYKIELNKILTQKQKSKEYYEDEIISIKEEYKINLNKILTQQENDKDSYEREMICILQDYEKLNNKIFTPLVTELCDGFIYCLSNKSNNGVYKIGVTSKQTPAERLKQLNSATGLLHPHKIEFSKKVINCKEKENQIHTFLSKIGKRVNPKREFFECELSIIKKLFELIDGI